MLNVKVRKSLLASALVVGLVLPIAQASAALSNYSENFESLNAADGGALSGTGWNTYVNAFKSANSVGYVGGYGFASQNNTGRGSGIDTGQGGVPQGNQQLVVYSDYGNNDQGSPNFLWLETNVYQERTVALADVGSVWRFQYDAKLGNLVAPSTALSFIKTLDPNNGYITTNNFTSNNTALPSTWSTYYQDITITPDLAGQLLQFGFSNNTSNYAASGVFYDNISFSAIPAPSSAGLLGLGGLVALRRRR